MLWPINWLFSTRPKREIWKAILFSLPFSRLIWKGKWLEWKRSKTFLSPDQQKRIFRFYPILIRSQYDLPCTFIENSPTQSANSDQNKERCAIVIHAYYLDVLEEILELLDQNISGNIPVYITSSPALTFAANQIAERFTFPFSIHSFENRGRDIEPFLQILPILKKDNIHIVLKLHTKKSIHLGGQKNTWLKNVLLHLVVNKNISRHFHFLQQNVKTGMIVPYGHLLPLALYYGDNSQIILQLSKRWNIPEQILGQGVFAAGSMFFIRLDAIHQLFSDTIPTLTFEEEMGQTDGTLAHALERMFAILCQSNKYNVVDSDATFGKKMTKVFIDHTFSR